ncbi:MAG TPA: hypothetical protein HA289_01150 [Ferroplasma sp.]|jgi:hypothetical protein|nr:hypothetical protein [Ferroplasma sp.]
MNIENVDEKKMWIIVSSRVGDILRDIRSNFSFLKHPILSMIKLSVLKNPWKLKTKDGNNIIIDNRDELFRERFKYLHKESYEANYVI